MPVDTLFFRGATPFDAGLNFHTASMFPPFPSVYAGALRRGEAIAARGIKIGWNGVMIKDELVFPRPLDTAFIDDQQVRKMELQKVPVSNHKLDYIVTPRKVADMKHVKQPKADHYVTESDFTNYLFGKKNHKLDTFKLDSYIAKESHIGIAVDTSTQTSIDGQWYTQEKLRLKSDVQLVVEAEGDIDEREGFVKLGGANKVARIHPLEESFSIMKREPSLEKIRYFKLYLATPAIFKNGWLPRWIDPKTMMGMFSFRKRKVKVRLIAAATGKPLPAGGFETYKNRPRSLHLAVPAGSVYFFELIEGEFKDVVQLMHRKNMSDYRETLGFDYPWYTRTTYCDRGFGFCFVGKMTDEQGGALSNV